MFELFGFLVTIDLVEGWLEIVQSILKGHSLLSIKNQNHIWQPLAPCHDSYSFSTNGIPVLVLNQQCWLLVSLI